MIVNTNFDVGDTFWVMSANKPITKVISHIRILSYIRGKYDVDYCVANDKSYNEKLCYKTKEELIASL